MTLRGTSRGIYMQATGDYLGLVHSDRWFSGSQVGRLDCVSSCQRRLKGGHRAQVNSDQRGGGQEIDGHCRIIDGHCRISDHQPNLHTMINQNTASNHFVTDDDEK
jgi:hypothetical protein